MRRSAGMTDALARLREMQAADLPVHGGRTLAYVYDSGLPDVDRIGREAVAAYAGSNGLDPTAFPSLLQMENDLVGFAADLLDAPAEAVGTVTSGGTESCLLAVQAARDSRPDVDRPRMVVPSTVHAAFLKAAHYFGVEAVVVPVGPDFRADAGRDDRGDRRATRPDRARRRLRAVVRARRHRPGPRGRGGRGRARDPLPRRRLHRRLGAAVRRAHRPRRAALDVRRRRRHLDLGRHCTSTPTPPRAPRCCCTARPRTGGRSTSRTPTGPATRCSTRRSSRRSPAARSPAPGRSCSRSATRATSSSPATSSRRSTGSSPASPTIPELRLVAAPDSTLVALATDGSCDAFTICDEMAAAGLVRPAADVVRRPAAQRPPLGQRGDPGARRRVPRRADRRRSPRPSPPARSASTRASPRSSRRSTRRRSPTTTSTGCSPRPGLVGGDGDRRPRPARPDGRGQRDARPRLAGDARGAAGRVPRPARPPTRAIHGSADRR